MSEKDTKNAGRAPAPSNTKYGDSVARATGQAAPDQGTSGSADEPNALLPKRTAAMLYKPAQAEIDALMSDPMMEFAPQVCKLEEGDMIIGILEGKGPEAEFTQMDPVTKEQVTRTVDTWIVAAEDGGLRLSLLSSAQLDRKLPPFIGDLVKIVRGKDIKTNNGIFRVTNYMVAGPKRADGPRSWVRPHVIDATAVEGAKSAGALPPGAMASPADRGGEDATA